MKWYAAHHGMPFDPKFQKVARRSGQPAIVIVGIWSVILDNVSQSKQRGTLDGFDPESVDIAMGMEDGTTQAVLDAMQGLLMDGDCVPAFMDRQPKDPTGADRKRKERALKSHGTEGRHDVSQDVTECHVTSRDVTGQSRDKSDCHTEERRGEDNRQDNKQDYYPADAGQFAFSGNVIRLKPDVFERWRTAFSAIPDIRAELTSLDDWMSANLSEADRDKWFWRASSALKKTHQKYLADQQPKKPRRMRGWNPGD